MADAPLNDNNQSSREAESAHSQTITLSPEEQLAFWKALTAPTILTAAQQQLGAVMRGDE